MYAIRSYYVNLQHKAGMTLLHMAARIGHLEVVKELLANKDIKVNLQSKNGHTPLHMAAYNGHVEVCKALIQDERIATKIKILWVKPLLI